MTSATIKLFLPRGDAKSLRTANGFVILHGSTAVLEERPSAESYPYVVAQIKQLDEQG